MDNRHSKFTESRRFAEHDGWPFRVTVWAKRQRTTWALKAALRAIALQYHLLIGVHAGLTKANLWCEFGIDTAQGIRRKCIGKLLPANVNQRIAFALIGLRLKLIHFTLKRGGFIVHRVQVLCRFQGILNRMECGLIDLSHLDLKLRCRGFYFRLIAGRDSTLDEIEGCISGTDRG